jgi:probable F420-dependent oxidoreductase
MTPIHVCFNQYGLAAHYGEASVIVRAARLAEAAGFHQFIVTDHVVMGERTDTYPYGPWPTPWDYPWWEPMTTMSVVAGATSRIRLSTGVLLAPLRPTVLLAKQAATLDQLSGGRLDLGVGVGWQEAEFNASGVPFETRKPYFIEQLRVMKKLWTERSVSFQGRFHGLEKIYCHPHPKQVDGIPLYVGVAPSRANLPWMVELTDGWLPIEGDPQIYAPMISTIKDALAAGGRDPAGFVFRARFPLSADPAAPSSVRDAFKQLPYLMEVGLTHVEFYPQFYLRTKDLAELDDVVREAGELISKYRGAR